MNFANTALPFVYHEDELENERRPARGGYGRARSYARPGQQRRVAPSGTGRRLPGMRPAVSRRTRYQPYRTYQPYPVYDPFAYPAPVYPSYAPVEPPPMPYAPAAAAPYGDAGYGDAAPDMFPHDDGQDAGSDAPQDEIPAPIRAMLAADKTGRFAQYNIGPELIENIVKRADLKGQPGTYLITFNHLGKRKAYSGKADDLQRRLLQHLHCLKFPVGMERQYMVYVEKLSSGALARSKEAALNRQRGALQGKLVNQTTELEALPFRFVAA